MRPWQHAVSSAREGGDWVEHLEVHEFLDSSKAVSADRRHRVVLHHVDLGAEIARRAFPGRSDIDVLARQHVEQDLGRQATLSDWMEGIDSDRLPRPIGRRIAHGRDGIVSMVASRLHPTQRDAVGEVARLLFSPCDHCRDHGPGPLSILMNSFGLALARRIFGPPLMSFESGTRVVTDWSGIAEAIIMACYGRIPTLGEVVGCVRSEPVRASGDDIRRAA